MIPFWPPIGLGLRGLIDYTIQMGGGSGPHTATTKEEVEQCMEALRKRDATIRENPEFTETYGGAI